MGRKLLRAAKWILFLVGGVLAVSPLVFYVLAGRAEARLERVLRDLASAGVPVKAAELAKPPIPDEENAALVFQEAFAAVSLSVEDQDLVRQVHAGESALSDPAVAAMGKDALDRNARALELVRRASTMAECRFPRDWSQGMETLFPEYGKLKSCSRLLAIDSLMSLQAGRADEALAACATMLRVADACEEPTLIGQLAKYAIIGITSRSVAIVLEHGRPSETACRSLADQIGGIELTPSFVAALQGERALGIWGFDSVRSAADPFHAIDGLASTDGSGFGPEGAPERADGPRPAAIFRWWLAFDELAYLRLIGRVIEEARLPHREVRRIRPSVEDQVESLRHRVPPRIMTAILVPVFAHSAKRRDQASATLGVDQIALLVKAYRAAHGEYPDSLAPLADFAGRPLPVDPFSGKAFRYERRGAGFVVYSIGLNLEDDGGTPRPPACKLRKPPRQEPVVIEVDAEPPPQPDDIVIKCTR